MPKAATKPFRLAIWSCQRTSRRVDLDQHLRGDSALCWLLARAGREWEKIALLYPSQQFAKTAIGAMSLVLLIVISPYAQETAIPTLNESQIADAAELKAAPWLICDSDLHSPVSRLWPWNPNRDEFGDLEIPEDKFSRRLVLIFDQEKHRALEVTVDTAGSPQTHVTSTTTEHDLRIGSELSARIVRDPFLSVLVYDASSTTEFMITQGREKDRSFVALFHDLGTMFSSYPVVTQFAASCSSSADDALKAKIEAARQTWLAAKPETPSGRPAVLQKGEWIADKKTGCYIWDDTPFPNELITWEGPCTGGAADGHGTLSWFYSDGTFYGRYDGDMRRGRLNGQGVYSVADGSHYEGQFRANRPDGLGSYTNAKGEIYKGTWDDGCFLEGNRLAVLGPTFEECLPPTWRIHPSEPQP